MVKSIASDDKLAMMLPPGESGVKKGVGVSGGWAWNNSLQSFNIFFKFVFTIRDVGAPFTKLMENTPKRDFCNFRSFSD